MSRRWLIESVVCAAVAFSATAAHAADDPKPAEAAHADATEGTAPEALASEAAPAADAADATTAQADDKTNSKKDEKGSKASAVAANAQNFAVTSGSDRPAFISGSVSFRTPVINDADPAGDRSMNYTLTGGFKLTKSMQIMARLSMTQQFVAQGGTFATQLPQGIVPADYKTINESPFRVGNLGFAFMYIDVEDLHIGDFSRKILWLNRAGLDLPTSRDAQNQSFYLGLSALSSARMNIIEELYVTGTGLLQWRGHEFAERDSPLGLPLPRFAMIGQVALEYQFTMPADFGMVTVGADISGSETVNYPSRDGHDSDTADSTFVRPGYGYDLYVTYVPLPFLFASVSWEQGGNVVRNGVVNTFFFHRDETRLAFTVTARY